LFVGVGGLGCGPVSGGSIIGGQIGIELIQELKRAIRKYTFDDPADDEMAAQGAVAGATGKSALERAYPVTHDATPSKTD
jgi:hypothetical protein